MKVFNRKFTFCIALSFLALLITPLFAQDDARAIAIRWAPVARARAYQIQLRTEGGRIIADRQLRNTVFERRLDPGTYYYRIAALGKVGKAVKFSPWLRVVVKPTRTPEIGAIVPKETSARGKRIEINGEGFLNESKAYLVRPTGGKVELPVTLINDELLSVFVSPALLGDGDYDIVVENPRGLKEEREEVIQIQAGQVLVEPSAQRGARRRAAPGEAVPAPDPTEKLNALWRSALLPGWGQYYQGRVGTAVGVAALQAGTWRTQVLRSKGAARAEARTRWHARNSLYSQRLSGFNLRDDVSAWLRLSEMQHAQFNASFATVQANTAGSVSAGFYLWNLLDVALYSGQGEASVGTGGALWRSAILPGWGQYASGRPLAGAVFSGAFVATGAGGVAHGLGLHEMKQLSDRNNRVRAWSAHYLTDTDIGEKTALLSYRDAVIERRRISSWKHELRTTGTALTAIYLANLVDLFIPWEAFGGIGGGGGESAGLYIGPGADGQTSLGLMLRF